MGNKKYTVSGLPTLARNNYNFIPVPQATNRVNTNGYRNGVIISSKPTRKGVTVSKEQEVQEVTIGNVTVQPIDQYDIITPVSSTTTKKRIGNKAVTVTVTSI